MKNQLHFCNPLGFEFHIVELLRLLIILYFDLHLFVGIFEQINLGVLETNPKSISGAMEVGQWLGQHVPKGPTSRFCAMGIN